MKRLPHHVLAGALALAALSPMGCKSDSSGGSGASADAATDPVHDAIDAALRDLSAQLSARAAAGWPAHLAMSSDGAPRPLLTIREIRNETTRSLDKNALKTRIEQVLLEGGLVALAASPAEPTPGADEMGEDEDPTGLELIGTLADERTEADGVLTHKVIVSLVVNDTVKARSVVKAQGEATGVSER